MKERTAVLWLALGALIAGAVLLWYLRTWLHPVVMVPYKWPAVLWAAVVWYGIHRFLIARSSVLTHGHDLKGEDGTHHGTWRWSWLVSPLVLMLVVGAAVTGASFARSVHLAEELNYQAVGELPESMDQVRIMPREVATRHARDALQLSQFRLGTDNILTVDGELSWTFPLRPDGLVITFLEQNYGMITVNAQTQERESQLVAQRLAVGEGMQITDNLWWNLYRHRYFVTTEDPYYLTFQGDILTIVPVIEYTFHIRWGLPYTVPRFAGLFTVTAGGDIQFMSHDEALEYPALAGNRIFPEELARTYIEAYRYRLGVINRLFIHEDQIDLQDVRRGDRVTNRQPFLMPSEDGLQWFASAEPHGESHGIFKIYLVDARTGDIRMQELPPESTLTGPVRAVDYVRRANPVVDWDRFDIVEPLPIVRDGILYWKLAVIPTDAAGVAYQVFLDSRNNEVFQADSDDDILAFVRGQDLQPPSVTPPGPEREAILSAIRQLIADMDDLLEQLEQDPAFTTHGQ